MQHSDDYYMALALAEARKAGDRAEVPIGAVLVHSQTGQIFSGGNNTITAADPTAHAEIEVIRRACLHEEAQRIPNYELYVTLEPCAMCTAAISFARIRRVVFGAHDPKGGGILHGGRFYEQPTCHHKPETAYMPNEECSTILKSFFAARRGR
ncbi:MAG: nucleoside deaminase [Alphaproteobacteria bacterium]|nr:nucleoside deaminase [Alphaproteobacteria bacterium]